VLNRQVNFARAVRSGRPRCADEPARILQINYRPIFDTAAAIVHAIVTLRGMVATSYQKTLAEKTAERISRTRLVINQIKIVGPGTDNAHSKPGRAARPSLAVG